MSGQDMVVKGQNMFLILISIFVFSFFARIWFQLVSTFYPENTILVTM